MMTEMSAHHAPPAANSATESNGARLSTLMDELRELEENNRELEEEYRKFEEKRHRVIRDIREMQQKELEDSRRVKKLVGFVETVERAHQYFDCKDYLAVTFGPDKSSDDEIKPHSVLVQHLIDSNICGTLSELDVKNAVTAYITEARAKQPVSEHLKKFREDYYQRLTNRSPSKYTKKDYEDMDRMFPDLCLTQPKDIDDGYAFSSPIFRYVFQSRKGQYEMDLNPEQELQKIKMSSEVDTDYYIFCLLEERRKRAKENGIVVEVEYDSRSLAKAKDKYRELLEHYSGKHLADRKRKRADEPGKDGESIVDAQHNA